MFKNFLVVTTLTTMCLHGNNFEPYYPDHPNYSDHQTVDREYDYSQPPYLVENYSVEGGEDYPPPTRGCTTTTYPYEAYPGMAYETSISALQVGTTVVVGIAIIALIVVAFRNTPCNIHCH